MPTRRLKPERGTTHSVTGPTDAEAVETALAAAAARPDLDRGDTTDAPGERGSTTAIDRLADRLADVERELETLREERPRDRPPVGERPRTFADGSERPRTSGSRLDADDEPLLDRLRSLW